MADMTQPEMPERASIPDNESQPSEDIVEPIHIGIARHRDTRESFSPLDPQTPNSGISAPTGPADRTAVESLRREAESMAARSQPAQAEEDKSSEFLGVPDVPGQEGGGFPLGRTIAGSLGVLAVTAAGFLGFNKIRSGDNGSERPGVIITDPTLEPATPPSPFTPEATLTKEPQKVEHSPYEFGWEAKLGDVTVRIEDELQTRTECPDPNVASKNAQMVPCFEASDLVVDRDNFSNVDNDMKETAMKAFYIAWRNQDDSRAKTTYEEYTEKLQKGEDLSFKTWGFQGASFLPTDIIINPADKIYLDFIAQPVSIIKPFTSLGLGYRMINNELHLEVFSFTMGNPKEPDKLIAATANYIQALAFLSNYDVLKKGFITSNAEYQPFSDVMNEIVGNLVKKQPDGTYISPLHTK